MIVEANARASARRSGTPVGLFLPVRQAWQQAERGLARQPPLAKPAHPDRARARRQPGLELERVMAGPRARSSGWSVMMEGPQTPCAASARPTPGCSCFLAAHRRSAGRARRNFPPKTCARSPSRSREMAPLVAQAQQLRAAHPGLREELELYARNLARDADAPWTACAACCWRAARRSRPGAATWRRCACGPARGSRPAMNDRACTAISTE